MPLQKGKRKESVMPPVVVSDYYSSNPNAFRKAASMSAGRSHTQKKRFFMISTQNKAFSAGHVTYFDEMSRKNLKTNTCF